MKLKLMWLFCATLFVVFSFTACGQKEKSNSGSVTNKAITVSAASSLTNAFEAIGRVYESKTGNEVHFNFGGSGVLQLQIERGAPVNVFASAGQKQMDALESQGLIVEESRSDFTRNVLVLIVPENSDLQLDSFNDLANPKLTRLTLGNPQTAPVGQYAKQSLSTLQLWNGLKPKLILAENVRQVLNYVTRGEVDAGLVYSSDAAIAKDKVTVAATAPEGSHNPILYPIAVIKQTEYKTAAKQFMELVLSKEGQNILQKYGFNSPG